jgi:hypothetical protein
MGSIVVYGKFGRGRVVNVEGHDGLKWISVNFDEVGVKWLAAMHANLQVVG